MDNKLKPCPFCGGTNIKLYSEKDETIHGFFHFCDDCDCRVKIESRLFDTDEEAIDMWNKRTISPNEPLSLKQLKERVGKPVYDNLLKRWCIVVKDYAEYFRIAYKDESRRKLDDGRFYDHEPKEE